MLLLLLIALFSFIIYIINRQKSISELKSDFINNLTHEFKTPLFSIGLTSKLLSKSAPVAESEKLSSYVDLIATENARLQTQVDKMLQITALESGNLVLEKKQVDVHRIIEKNISCFHSAVEEKGGTIVFKPSAKRYGLAADEVHLFNVISNLIDNAYKYSHDKPQIIVSTSNGHDGINIQVEDNGIGMDESAQKMIFDKFYRVRNGNVHDVKGFGLGLSYVKKIIQMHKGSVHVKSKPEEGTTFFIHLPFE